MREVAKVEYSYDSGSILPELQEHIEVSITKDEVIYTRNGKSPDSMVNQGSWTIAVDPSEIDQLFLELVKIDCKEIKRIEPQDPPDGGYTQSYSIELSNGKSCVLNYDPGVSYENGEQVKKQIDDFISHLALP